MPTLNRTLLIGLGGTGVEVLRKFKRRYVDLYDREQKYVKLLAFDTADQIDSKDPKLSAHEFLHLGSPAIAVADIVDQRHDNPCLGWIKDRVPPFDIVQGAGMKRLYGHLAYFWRGRDIRQTLDAAISSLYSAELNQEFEDLERDCRVFVISSLCGGTGTGMFLDISYLAQHLIATKNQACFTFGMLFLPSAFPQLVNDQFAWQSINANGYAALQELNYYMREDFEATELYSPDPFSPKMRLTRPPFHLCYLLGGVDMNGNRLTSSEDLYERTAEFLFANTVMPNIKSNIVAYITVNSERSYASFGSFSMELPYSRYIERYVLSMGEELLTDILESEPDAKLEVIPAKIFGIDKSKYRIAAQLADSPEEIHVTTARFEREVKVHGEPADHADASRYIEEEWSLLNTLRDALAKEHAEVAEALVVELRDRIKAAIAENWRIRKGTVQQLERLLVSFIAEFDRLYQRLGGVPGITKSLDEAYADHRDTPSRFEIFNRTTPQKRLDDFRADVAQIFEQEIKKSLAKALQSALATVRADCEQQKRAVTDLRERAEVVRQDFRQTAREFLGNRRKQDTGSAFQRNAIGDVAIPDNEYKDDRFGLLSKCRADMNMDLLCGSLEKPKSDISRFVQELYKLVSKYISEKKSGAQLFDKGKLLQGLNEAQINVQLKYDPRTQSRKSNWLFLPTEPTEQRLKKAALESFQEWPGAEGRTPQVFPSTDDTVLTYVQILSQFQLRELADIQAMAQAYQAKLLNQKIYLDLPTHERMELVISGGDAKPKEIFGLAILLGTVKETGQNYRFRDGYLLGTNIENKIERRRAGHAAVMNPDKKRFIDQARVDKEFEGNEEFARFVEQRLTAVYSGLDPHDEYDQLLLEEKEAVERYIDSLGVKKGRASSNQ